jgi:hypothetical protein
LNVAVDILTDDFKEAINAINDLEDLFASTEWSIDRMQDDSFSVSGVVLDADITSMHALLEEGIACNAKTIQLQAPKVSMRWSPTCR